MRKRSTYRPRPIHANAVERAIEGARRPNVDGRLKLHACLAEVLDEYPRGIRCREHWKTAADALNMAETLHQMRVLDDEDEADVIEAGQQVLAAVAMRAHAPGGTWTLRASELQALREALGLHERQVDKVSQTRYEQAWERTEARVRGAKAGSAPRGAVVVQLPEVVA